MPLVPHAGRSSSEEWCPHEFLTVCKQAAHHSDRCWSGHTRHVNAVNATRFPARVTVILAPLKLVGSNSATCDEFPAAIVHLLITWPLRVAVITVGVVRLVAAASVTV